MKKILILTSNSELPHISGHQDTQTDMVYDSSTAVVDAMSGTYNAVIAESCLIDKIFLQNLSKIKKTARTIAYITAKTDVYALIDAGITEFCTKNTFEAKINELYAVPETKKEQILVRTLNKLINIAQSTSQGILIFDTSGQITFSNNAANKILKLEKSKLALKKLNDIFIKHPYKSSQSDTTMYEQESHTLADGTEILLDSLYSSTIDSGKFSGYVLLFSPSSAQALDRHQELELLKFQQRYHSTQQNAAFKKQMLVIKDETSGTICGRYAFETYFKPLDIMSGDIYGSMNIKDGRYFFYIIDAMGKGLSASVTALQSSSFINHAAEIAILKNDFDLSKLLTSFTRYIRDRLLEEEALCAVFALLDTRVDSLSIVNFGMPPVLLCKNDGSVEKIKSKNMPIMRFMADRTASVANLRDVEKILIYSDGLSEAETNDGLMYFEKLPEHVKTSATKKHLLRMFNDNVSTNDDDLTFFYISTTDMAVKITDNFSVMSSHSQIGAASDRISAFLNKNTDKTNEIPTIEFAISEMLMNALEHGSLGISFDKKREMISNGTFDSYMMDNTAENMPAYTKEIKISCRIVKRNGLENDIAIIVIEDSGHGFIVPEIFKFHSFDGNICHLDSRNYNGRGIFITDNMVDGLFYNEKGNKVYVVKILD